MDLQARARLSLSSALGQAFKDKCWCSIAMKVWTTRPWGEYSLGWLSVEHGVALMNSTDSSKEQLSAIS